VSSHPILMPDPADAGINAVNINQSIEKSGEF
jgi:hypothetical protein